MMVVVVIVAATVIVCASFTYGVEMSVRIVTETVVVNEVRPPVRMSADPDMEMIDPDRVADQPDVARAEVKILIAYDPDVFITVPYIIIGNHTHIHSDSGRRGWLRLDHDRRGRCHHDGFKSHSAIGLHHATRDQNQSPGGQGP